MEQDKVQGVILNKVKDAKLSCRLSCCVNTLDEIIDNRVLREGKKFLLRVKRNLVSEAAWDAQGECDSGGVRHGLVAHVDDVCQRNLFLLAADADDKRVAGVENFVCQPPHGFLQDEKSNGRHEKWKNDGDQGMVAVGVFAEHAYQKDDCEDSEPDNGEYHFAKGNAARTDTLHGHGSPVTTRRSADSLSQSWWFQGIVLRGMNSTVCQWDSV
jgi:hypothetical protein